MISLLVTLFVLLSFAAFLAASEMAFISVHPVRLREQAEKGTRGAQSILKLRGNSQHFLGAILIATNMMQVSATAVMSYLFESHFMIHSELLVTVIMTTLFLVFCEMLPKEYARLHALQFLTQQQGALVFLNKLFYWPAHFVIRMTTTLFPAFNQKHEKIFMNEVEFKALVAESERQGVLDPHERDFVNMILDFERIAVKSVMVPIVRVAAVEIHSNIQSVRKCAREKNDRVVLVYEGERSIVAGVIYVFDVLLKECEEGSMTEFLKAPLFVSETMSLEQAFRILQKKRQSFALVTDKRYEVIGVVHIENLLLGRQV